MATKTWKVSNLEKSRHPQMDGETVDIGDRFSNGLEYPGAPGNPDETSGCKCWIETEVTAPSGKYKLILENKPHTDLPEFATNQKLENSEWGPIIVDLLAGREVPAPPEGYLTWWDVISYLLLKSSESDLFNLKHFGPGLGIHYHPHKGPFDEFGNVIQWVDQFGSMFTNKLDPAAGLDPADHSDSRLHATDALPPAPPVANDPDLFVFDMQWEAWRAEVGIVDEKRQYEAKDTEEEAWRRYTSHYHFHFSEFLRKGISHPMIAEHVDQLDALIKKRTLDSDIVLYRGYRERVVGLLDVGDEFQDLSYTSTSVDPEIVREFGDAPKDASIAWKDAKYLELQVPAGTNYALGYETESEVILPRGMTWEVVANDETKMTMKLVTNVQSDVVQNEGSPAHTYESYDVMEHRYEVEDSYTPAQKAAMDVYVSGDYEGINEALRGVDTQLGIDIDEAVTAVDTDLAEWIHHLDGMTTNVIEKDLVLYRGLTDEHTLLLAPDMDFTDQGFVSTSWSEAVAMQASRQDDIDGDGGDLLRIHVPAGTKFAYGYKDEEEILLPRNSKFHVVGFDEEDFVWDVEVVETPTNNMPLPADANFPDLSELSHEDQLKQMSRAELEAKKTELLIAKKEYPSQWTPEMDKELTGVLGKLNRLDVEAAHARNDEKYILPDQGPKDWEARLAVLMAKVGPPKDTPAYYSVWNQTYGERDALSRALAREHEADWADVLRDLPVAKKPVGNGTPKISGPELEDWTAEQSKVRDYWVAPNANDDLPIRAMNRKLREGGKPSAFAKKMDKLVQINTLEEASTGYRGASLTVEDVEKLVPGKEFVDPGFAAFEFGNGGGVHYAVERARDDNMAGHPDRRPVIFQIDLPAGQNVASVSYGEYVLPRGIKYEILEVYKQDEGADSIVVHLKVASASDAVTESPVSPSSGTRKAQYKVAEQAGLEVPSDWEPSKKHTVSTWHSYGSYDKKEIHAILDYTRISHRSVNNLLRGEAPSSYLTDAQLEANRKQTTIQIERLRSAMSKATTSEDLTAYRRMDVPGVKEMDDLAFTSVSLDVAMPVVGALGEKTRVKFTIPSGTQFVPGSEYESEMILPEGAHWEFGEAGKDEYGPFVNATLSFAPKTVNDILDSDASAKEKVKQLNELFLADPEKYLMGDDKSAANLDAAQKDAARALAGTELSGELDTEYDVVTLEYFSRLEAAGEPKATNSKPIEIPKPMLLKEQRDSFDSDDWIFQKKYDGQRAIVTLQDGKVTVHSRTLQDITDQFPELQALPAQLGLEVGTYQFDGELAVFDADGKTDIDLIQKRRIKGPDGKYNPDKVPIRFAVFDMLNDNGKDLTGLSIEERQEHLAVRVTDSDLVFITPTFTSGTKLFEEVRARGEEGIVAKHKGSTYQAGKRSPDWIKVKFYKQAEVVIGGWEEGKGERAGRLGAIQMGVFNSNGEFVHVGNLGSGLSGDNLDAMEAALKELEVPDSPFDVVDGKLPQGTHFVSPRVVLTTEFTDLTEKGKLRQPKFIQLRDDKISSSVKMEDLLNAANPPQLQVTATPDGAREFEGTGSHKSNFVEPMKVMQEEAKSGVRSSDEDETVDWYASNGFNEVNPWLRGRALGDEGESDMSEKSFHLDRAVEGGSLSEPTVVWRGVKPSFTKTYVDDIHEGLEFTDAAFTSTTLSQFNAEHFSGGQHLPGSTLFRLVLPSGMHFTVGSIAEAELLLGRDLKFRVGKRHDKTDTDPAYWDLEIVV